MAISTSLVNEVDGLVGKIAAHNVLCASSHGIVNGRRSIGHVMITLIAALQAVDYFDGLINRRL